MLQFGEEDQRIDPEIPFLSGGVSQHGLVPLQQLQNYPYLILK